MRSFAIRSSKWNKSLSSENIVIKVRDNLEFDREFFEDHEPDWRYLMYWSNKCAFTNVSDVSETLDSSLMTGHETHGILNLALGEMYPSEVQERCN